MFVPRLISGIVLVIIAVITVNLGGAALWGICLFISLVGMMEMYRVFGVNRKGIGIWGYVCCVFYYAALWLDSALLVQVAVTVLFLGTMIAYVCTFPKYRSEEAMTVLFGYYYPAVLLSYLFLLRNIPEGSYLVWLVFLASWGSDTCAYCVGMLCKKLFHTHQMTPVLSPKKSVEGGIGGLAGAFLLGFLYGCFFDRKITSFILPVPVACGLLCLIGGVISMVGDLAASAVKRNHGIKDYGHLIPGHGGIMDRFDSIVFAAPVLYYVARFLQI